MLYFELIKSTIYLSKKFLSPPPLAASPIIVGIGEEVRSPLHMMVVGVVLDLA